MSNDTHTGVSTPLDAANGERIHSHTVRHFLGLTTRLTPGPVAGKPRTPSCFFRPIARTGLSPIASCAA